MVRIQKKFQKAVSVLEYFTTREWKFNSSNVKNLYEKLSEHDSRTFNFDVKQVNWKNYIENYVEGIRLYILKEDPANSQKAKIHLRRLESLLSFSLLFFPLY